MDSNGTIRGMVCRIRFFGDPNKYPPVYISFGDYDEENDRDTFGVPDYGIFYYCTADELRECVAAAAEGRMPTLSDEWEVTDWDREFVYDDREASNN